MAYSTKQMLRQALAPGTWVENPGQPTDPDDPSLPNEPPRQTNTAADLPDEQLDDAIAEADAFIDSYIGARYTVPVAPVGEATVAPHPIDYWSRNLAAYNATLAYSERQDFGDDDPVARRYTATLAALTAVRDGKGTLPIPPIDGAAGSLVSVGSPVNPYVGDLFSADDWSLAPARDWRGEGRPYPQWPFF